MRKIVLPGIVAAVAFVAGVAATPWLPAFWVKAPTVHIVSPGPKSQFWNGMALDHACVIMGDYSMITATTFEHSIVITGDASHISYSNFYNGETGIHVWHALDQQTFARFITVIEKEFKQWR